MTHSVRTVIDHHKHVCNYHPQKTNSEIKTPTLANTNRYWSQCAFPEMPNIIIIHACDALSIIVVDFRIHKWPWILVKSDKICDPPTVTYEIRHCFEDIDTHFHLISLVH